MWEVMDLDGSWQALLIFIILAGSIAHACLLLLISPEKSLVRGSLVATIICIAIVACMLIFIVADEFFSGGDFYFRLLGVFVILDVLGTIVTPILHKVYSLKH